MRRALIAAAACAALALTGTASGAPGLATPAVRPAALPASWTVVDQGARGGVTWGGPPVDGVGAVYLPAKPANGRLRVAYVLGGGADAPALAHELGIAGSGDQLAWQRTTPPFAVVVTTLDGTRALAEAMQFAQAALPLSRVAAGRAVVGLGAQAPLALHALLQPQLDLGTGIAIGGRIPSSLNTAVARAAPVLHARRDRIDVATPLADASAMAGARAFLHTLTSQGLAYRATFPVGPNTAPLWRHELLDGLGYAFATEVAERASRAATAVAPAGWTRIAVGPDGGTIWQGVIPDLAEPGHPRASLVYLPPNVRSALRYPALYLLHGIRGSPYSFVGGLRLAAVADGLIHAGRLRPFIAVMPPAGLSPQFDGEWTGPWARYVVQDVLPWADRHLPLAPLSSARALAGYSAGGYGSLDIALRNPGLFGTLESWSGYYTAPTDGSLTGATPAQRLANDPVALLPPQAAALRAAHLRVFLSVGRRERKTLQASRGFALELSALRLDHVLHVTSGGHRGRTWRTILPLGLLYAFGSSPSAR